MLRFFRFSLPALLCFTLSLTATSALAAGNGTMPANSASANATTTNPTGEISFAAATDSSGSSELSAVKLALDAAIDRNIASNKIIGAVVLVAKDGQLIYHRAVGYSDPGQKIAMQENSIFRLASVSKAYTSLAAAVLLDQGKMQLDDPVTKWLPYFTPALPNGEKPVITVGQLLTHTAGLNYPFFEADDGPYHKAGVSAGLDVSGITLEENLKRIAAAPLLFTPGTNWHYSMATDVLGAVVAKVHGTSLPQALRELVTLPLNIKDSGYFVTDRNRLTVPCYIAGGLLRPMEKDTFLPFNGTSLHFSPARALNPNEYTSGGAGMVGTASDLLVLLETMRNGGAPILSKGAMQAMMSNQIGDIQAMGPGVGHTLGWGVVLDSKAAGMLQNEGTVYWMGVYGHSWFVDPVNGLSVVVFTTTAMDDSLKSDVTSAIYGAL